MHGASALCRAAVCQAEDGNANDFLASGLSQTLQGQLEAREVDEVRSPTLELKEGMFKLDAGI